MYSTRAEQYETYMYSIILKMVGERNIAIMIHNHDQYNIYTIVHFGDNIMFRYID